jgi:hypothetical protein
MEGKQQSLLLHCLRLEISISGNTVHEPCSVSREFSQHVVRVEKHHLLLRITYRANRAQQYLSIYFLRLG